jgi:hypothetical protein
VIEGIFRISDVAHVLSLRFIDLGEKSISCKFTMNFCNLGPFGNIHCMFPQPEVGSISKHIAL